MSSPFTSAIERLLLWWSIGCAKPKLRLAANSRNSVAHVPGDQAVVEHSICSACIAEAFDGFTPYPFARHGGAHSAVTLSEIVRNRGRSFATSPHGDVARDDFDEGWQHA
jgi:hypothetical protein